jgi:beta-N-acetylhexosaminidase
MGFEGTEPDNAVRSLVREHQPGGVILFARNIVSAPQTYMLLRECRRHVDVPIFACVDLEGGMVDRLKNVIAPAPSPAAVASTGDKRLFRKHGEVLGAEARALGFNVDFAPVSDLGFETSRKVMGSRTISPKPETTIVYVREFLRGLRSARVLGCGKHYPGLGEADLDSHLVLPSIKKSFKRLWAEDLVPYRSLQRRFPFVMVAHAAYPEVTGNGLPASLSRHWMYRVLRQRIGYRGIVLSDDLEMGGVLAAGSIEHAAVETLRAGADMFLVCRKEEFVRSTFEAVLREAEQDARFRGLVLAAHARVVRFKRRAPEMKRMAPMPTETTVSRLRRQMARFTAQVEKAQP